MSYLPSSFKPTILNFALWHCKPHFTAFPPSWFPLGAANRNHWWEIRSELERRGPRLPSRTVNNLDTPSWQIQSKPPETLSEVYSPASVYPLVVPAPSDDPFSFPSSLLWHHLLPFFSALGIVAGIAINYSLDYLEAHFHFHHPATVYFLY